MRAGAALLLGVAVVVPAWAQDAGVLRSLAEQLQQIRGNLNTLRGDVDILQRDVYARGPAPAAPAPAAGAAPGPAAPVAGFQFRLDALEGEIRGLTGALEEIRRAVEHAVRLAEDLEFRIRALEQRPVAGSAAAAPAGAQVPVEVPPGGDPGAAGRGFWACFRPIATPLPLPRRRPVRSTTRRTPCCSSSASRRRRTRGCGS